MNCDFDLPHLSILLDLFSILCSIHKKKHLILKRALKFTRTVTQNEKNLLKKLSDNKKKVDSFTSLLKAKN